MRVEGWILTGRPPVVLELALSEWALARHEAADEAYVTRLRRAEELFRDPLVDGFEPAVFALSRFYRLTFRPLDACETFPRSTGNIQNLRRLLRESCIYGEASAQLSYADYPEPVTHLHLSEARILLETCLAAGYQHARVVVAMAFVRGILEGSSAAFTAIKEIYTGGEHLSWETALQLIEKASDTDLPSLGFALGINSSAVLTRLGTFSRRFLEDQGLAETLYRAAVRADGRDPVALTNLARFLMNQGGSSKFQEARRLLQKAANFADRRFRWWRGLLAELDELDPQPRERPSIRPSAERSEALPPAPECKTFKQIRDWYRRVSTIADEQSRGYELERLLLALANLTFGTAGPSYRFTRPLVGKVHQTDASFSHRGHTYRCEFKWQENRVSYDDMLKLIDKLDVVGVSGFFVSMSGFDERAIRKAEEVRGDRAVLLMDCEEVDAVMNGRLNFDEVVTVKRLHFEQRSQVYFRSTSVEVD